MSTYDNGGMCCPLCGSGHDLEWTTKPPHMTGGVYGRPAVRCLRCRYEDPDFARIDEQNRRAEQAAADRECEELGHRVIALLGKCTRCNRPMSAEAS